MNKDIEAALDKIDGQLYAINSRNISLPWIGMQKTPTMEEILQLNRLLAFIIHEIRVLKKDGKLDVEATRKEYFDKHK